MVGESSEPTMKTQLVPAGRLTTMLSEVHDAAEVVLDEVEMGCSGKTAVCGTALLDGELVGFEVTLGTEKGDVIFGLLEVTVCETDM